MEDISNDHDDPSKLKEFLNSYSSSTYLAEFYDHLAKMENMEQEDRIFYFNHIIKQIIVNAMFEYEHCKTELETLFWRYKFSCHPGEEEIARKEIVRVRENMKDLEKLFQLAKKSQPQI